MLTNRIAQERPARRERRGVSLIEVIVAMTLLAVTLGSLGLLAAKTAARARALDVSSARTFVLMQQSNRFSVLPYDSIPVYAPRTDTVISGRFKYARNVTYSQGTTGSEYRKVIVILTPLSGSTKPDSLVFQRAKIYAKSPLFT
jgi:prepilin-type N-terminal cleavage/methylation domain-containing protein